MNRRIAACRHSAALDRPMLLTMMVASAAAATTFRALKRFHRKQRSVRIPRPECGRTRAAPEPSDCHAEPRPLGQEREVHRNLVASTILTGIAGVGAVALPVLSTATIPGFIYLSLPVFTKAVRLLLQGKVGIETILMFSCLTAFAAGYVFVMGLTYVLYYLSEKLALMVQNNVAQGYVGISGKNVQFTWLRVNGTDIRTRVDQLKKGDIIVVRAGESIPVDGILDKGAIAVDQRVLTGESQLADKTPGDYVYASTLVLSGEAMVRVDKAGAETAVANVERILNETVELKSSTQMRAEALANKTVLPTLAFSLLALPALGAASAICILQSHFSYRIRLVAPVSALSYFKRMSDHGILIKDARTLDLLKRVDTVVFDKTGTLTEDAMHVSAVHSHGQVPENELVSHAATAEQHQQHPVAKAILAEAAKRGLTPRSVERLDCKVGFGITLSAGGSRWQIGSERFMQSLGIVAPEAARSLWDRLREAGRGWVGIALDGRLVGTIEVQPNVRPEAASVIQALRRVKGIEKLYILSGDQEAPTRHLAQELGIDDYFAETLPEQKAAVIEGLLAEGRTVCFVGDGINDAIAMKKAHVSVSLKGASGIAADTAQILLMDGNLRALPKTFETARAFHRNINAGFACLLVPSLLGMGGAVLLSFGPAQAVILTQAGLLAGLANSVAPRLKGAGRGKHPISSITKDSE